MPVPDYIATEEQQITGEVINLPFYPNLTLQEMQDRYQTDETYNETKRLNYLKQATLFINHQLKDQLKAWQELNVNTLQEVPQTQLGDDYELELMYQTAVYSKAMALIAERYRATDSTRNVIPKMDVQISAVEAYENESRSAVMYLLGYSNNNVTVDLI